MTEKPSNDGTLIFLHVQKTAGTTLHRIIERHYPSERLYSFDAYHHTYEHFTSLSEEERAAICLLRGHMVFGAHHDLPNPSTYFTVLRDPVERVISYYYHVRRDPNHHWHDFVLSNDLDLKAFVQSGVDIGMANFQTRVLAGGRWHDSPYGACPQEALKVAKRHLREHFTVTGLVRKFDATLLLLKDAFGWQDLFYVRRNVTRQRLTREELPSDALDAVVEANQLDLQLYNYGDQLFEQRVQEKGAGFGLRVILFQLLNRYLGPYLYAPRESGERATCRVARSWARRLSGGI